MTTFAFSEINEWTSNARPEVETWRNYISHSCNRKGLQVDVFVIIPSLQISTRELRELKACSSRSSDT
jgi:hypothetical protein